MLKWKLCNSTSKKADALKKKLLIMLNIIYHDKYSFWLLIYLFNIKYTNENIVTCTFILPV